MKAIYYIAIDDTDNLESRGTGHQARSLAAHLAGAGLGRQLGVTRHQLLVDPRIPYTSHNSSACLRWESEDGSRDELIRSSAAFPESAAAPGSDAGLCVAAESQVNDAVLAWGQRAKCEVLTKEEAYQIAAAAGIHLSGHTGKKIGVIGSLAAVGLRHAGEDGRFLLIGTLREMKGPQTRAALEAAGVGVFRCENSENLTGPNDLIDVGNWCRAVMVHGEPTLLIEEVVSHATECRWRILPKERIKQY